MTLTYTAGTDQRSVRIVRDDEDPSWVVLDELGDDTRVVERVDGVDDAQRDEAESIAADYAEQAAAAGEPLVRAAVGV